jgi:DNA-directed RNA polymerase subunit omega
MMLRPSIDSLLEKIDSKYSLVVLEGKRAHELIEEHKEYPNRQAGTMPFESVKPTLQALEEIAAGKVTIHPDTEAKHKTIVEKKELYRLYRLDEERRIKEQIAKEQEEEEEKQKSTRSTASA